MSQPALRAVFHERFLLHFNSVVQLLSDFLAPVCFEVLFSLEFQQLSVFLILLHVAHFFTPVDILHVC